MIRGLPPMPLPEPRTPAPTPHEQGPGTGDFAAWLPTAATPAAPAAAGPGSDVPALPDAEPSTSPPPAPVCFPSTPSPAVPTKPAIEPSPDAPPLDAFVPLPSGDDARKPVVPTPAKPVRPDATTQPIAAPPAPGVVEAPRRDVDVRTQSRLEPVAVAAPEAATAAVDAAAAAVGDATVIVDPAAGRVEIVSPWRLIADGSLSQLGRDALAPTTPGYVVGVHANAGELVARAGLPSGTLPFSAAAAWRAPSGATPPAWRPAPAEADVVAGAAASADADPAASAPHAANWSLRLLRWFEADGRGATAWLRDYTLDADGEARLVDDVRRFAEHAGLPLRRVVLNGRTLWSADPISTETR